MTRFILSLGVLLIPWTDSVAQEASEIIPGVEVRVSVPTVSKDKIEGTVVSFDAETLILKPRNILPSPLSIPVSDLGQLEVSKGRKTNGSRVLKGAGVGTLAGCVTGLVVGTGIWVEGGRGAGLHDKLVILFLPIITTPIGLVIGTIAGAIPTDQSETVSLPSRPQMGMRTYQCGGVGVEFSYRF